MYPVWEGAPKLINSSFMPGRGSDVHTDIMSLTSTDKFLSKVG